MHLHTIEGNQWQPNGKNQDCFNYYAIVQTNGKDTSGASCPILVAKS